MVKNAELFKKVMKFSKELKMSAEGPFAGKPPIPPHGLPGIPPFAAPGIPPFPPTPGFRIGGRRMRREHLLSIFNEYPDGIRQKELAEKACINASSCSEIVSKLEDDGYITRMIDPVDRRATVLRLTEMGRVRAHEVSREKEQFLDVYFGKLTDEEKQTLSDILDKLMSEDA